MPDSNQWPHQIGEPPPSDDPEALDTPVEAPESPSTPLDAPAPRSAKKTPKKATQNPVVEGEVDFG